MTDGCTDWRKMMHRALDGELDGGERARLDDHLCSCEACRKLFASYELSLAVFSAIPAPEPGPGFAAEAVRKAVAAKQAQARRQRIFAWSMVASIAAASVAALGAWAQVLQPALWGILTWIPRALSGLWSLASATSTTLATLVRALLPLGGAAAEMAWEGLLMFLPLYAIALAMMVFITLASRTKRPAARLPVLSL